MLEEFQSLVGTNGGVDKVRLLIRELAAQGVLAGSMVSDRVELADIAIDLKNGISKRSGKGGIPTPVLRLADIKDRRISTNSLRRIPLTADEQEKYLVEAGDILVIRVNGSADLVGSFIPALTSLGHSYSDHLIRLRLDHKRADYRYICILAASQRARRHIVGKTVSTAGQKTVNQKGLSSLSLPLPPLPEQKRIVAKVDQLMALCDELEDRQKKKRETSVRLNKAALNAVVTAPNTKVLKDSWKRVQDHFEVLYDLPENVKELRQTILQLAVMGKLVRQDAKDEPAEKWLTSHLGAEKFASDPVAPGWVSALVQDLFEVGTGSTPTKTDSKYWKGGTVPWVSSAKTNEPDITSPTSLVTEKAVADFRLKLHPAGSLVVALYGQGKTRGQVSRLRIDACVNQACAVLRVPPDYPTLMQWIWLCFRKQYEELRELAAGGAQPNLNVGIVKRTRLPIPPRGEMQGVVTKVDQLMALCDDLEAKLNQSREHGQRLMQAVVESLVA